ncbi:MAG: catechol 1,2-dioxygenase [bacterium]|nr:catechol 1,2-dioxygenase [bacterium]
MTEQNDRVTKVAVDIIDTIKDRLAANDVNHQEFMAAVQFMGKLAGSGEMPLFMMVFFEAAVERITFDHKPGTKGAVQGPYFKEHSKIDPPYRLPMREDEPGDPIIFSGKITDLDGNPLAGVSVDTWHSGNDGTYSGFNPVPPENNLRGIMETDENGEFRFASIRPAPYQIPHAGPTGQFLLMIGRHAWRPAHFHFKLNKEGYDPLTTQIYFEGDEIIEGQGDIVGGVKDELIISIGEGSDPEIASTYGVPVPYQTAEYSWRLRPAS